jgi:hypothetical protein
MSLKVVPLRDKPALTDIVAQVRNFADRIESGDLSDISAVFAVVPIAGNYPKILGWGDVAGINDPVVQLELAKLWLLTNLVERRD